MKSEHKGWVIINIGHPTTGFEYICDYTFSYRRKDAIKKFVDGSGNDWNYWRNKYNFRVVKANQTVTIKPL